MQVVFILLLNILEQLKKMLDYGKCSFLTLDTYLQIPYNMEVFNIPCIFGNDYTFCGGIMEDYENCIETINYH